VKQNIRFVWIDDNKDRQTDSKNLSDELEIKVDFINVNKIEIDKELTKLIQGTEPNLIIMDHSLDQVNSETYRTGSTAASFIHEHWHECPIVSFTGVDINNIDIRHKAAYEAMYPINRISDFYNTILSIAFGFDILKKNRPKDITSLIKLYNCPEDDIDKMKKILPKELKENFEDKSILLEIYRWSKSFLFKRPGFLYNSIWAATFLGLNEAGFEVVKDKIIKAKYNGIFEDSSNERWWKSKLIEEVGELTQEIGLPWIIGRKLVDYNEKYFSKCFSSGEDYPETVAAEDMTLGASWKPMKLKFTVPHPNFEDMLFFEELRLMNPA